MRGDYIWQPGGIDNIFISRDRTRRLARRPFCPQTLAERQTCEHKYNAVADMTLFLCSSFLWSPHVRDSRGANLSFVAAGLMWRSCKCIARERDECVQYIYYQHACKSSYNLLRGWLMGGNRKRYAVGGCGVHLGGRSDSAVNETSDDEKRVINNSVWLRGERNPICFINIWRPTAMSTFSGDVLFDQLRAHWTRFNVINQPKMFPSSFEFEAKACLQAAGSGLRCFSKKTPLIVTLRLILGCNSTRTVCNA